MSTPITIALCEDTPQDAAAMQTLLERLAPDAQIAFFASGEEFLAADPAGKFDLVLMDIYMSGMTGLETARTLRQKDKTACIVFTTTSEDHALEGYRVRAMQYLVKPVQEEDVAEVLAALQTGSSAQGKAEPLTLVIGGEKRQIDPGDILYVEVFGKKSLIHVTAEVLETQTPIGELSLLLPSADFVRCHRAYIVNLAHVARLDGDFTMANGDTVYVRVKDLPAIRKAWNRYMAEALRREG